MLRGVEGELTAHAHVQIAVLLIEIPDIKSPRFDHALVNTLVLREIMRGLRYRITGKIIR
ncbi:hypothetical protein D3C71_2111010 [compost metagenome]